MLLDGRYRLDSVLARGGMSTVYRGLDTRLDRPVAIKVMDRRFAGDRSFLDRFIREAKATARLRHPAVVSVYDQGVDRSAYEDQVFLVMELVDGGTLRDLLHAQGELPVPLALSVLEPVLAALAAAHREGLVHRDIKPENVLIGRGGEVKVADFGLVRAVADAGSTSDSVILGTVAYLSPEQVATGAADARSDVYAAGIMLFEMLTGAPPYTGDTALSVAYRHVNDDVPPPSSGIPGIPPALDELVVRATGRNPDTRPPNAASFLVALQRVRHDLGIRRVRVPVPAMLDEAGGDTVPATLPNRNRRPPHQSVQPVRHHPPRGSRPEGGRPAPGSHGPQGTRAYPRMPRDPAAEAPPAHAPQHVPQRRPVQPDSDPYLRERARDRRIFLVWTAIILLLAALIGYGAWHLAIGRWTAVPSLDNLDHLHVELALRAAGLDPEVIDDHHDVVPAGRLVSVQPAPGTRVLRGRVVRAVLSQGRPRVPDIVTGTPLDQARSLLDEADLRLDHDPGADQYDEAVPESGVLRVRPPAGTELTVGTPVELVLSKGPPPVDVPDVRDRTVEEAAAALAGAGLRVAAQRRERFDAKVPAGRVASTDPPAGRTTRKGGEVILDVSNALVVPDVTGKPRPEALAALRAGGFQPQETGDGAGNDGSRVASTEPAKGSLVDPAASRITVRLSFEVTVPALVGLRVDEARETLSRLGLRAEVRQLIGGESSTVLMQSPGAGSRLAPGSAVQLSAF
jgi:serine/threonine protein kinase/beta-lactam-binding protein with PASTA domain